MSQTAVLVWLSASSLTFGASSPSADLPTFRADLDAFAHSRLLRLEAPRENAAAYRDGRASAYAPDVVAQVEISLEEARNAAASLEQSRALGALERAEHLLREHPELPQSAWLMAEIFEQSAEVEESAPDGADAANSLRRRAAALEGPRAAPFSDRAPTLGREADAVSTQPISVEGLEPGDTLEWDGMQTQTALRAAPGDHHVRVVRGGRLLWAGWLNLGASERRPRLPVPETIACSSDDVGRAHFAGGRAIAAAHARCESYVLARPHPGGGIEAALCEREQCGKVVIWEHVHGASPSAASSKKPIWPYAIAASAGALALTGIALWRAGVFDRGEPNSRETWVFNGQQKQMSLSF